MNPGTALFLVCRLAYRLKHGPDDAFLPIDEPLLLELVGMDYAFYLPRLVPLQGFRVMVHDHYDELGLSSDFLTITLLEWMLMVFELLLFGEMTLAGRLSQEPEVIVLE